MYDFDEQTLSDLHKDARGFRPRSELFWATWATQDADGKQAIWDGLIRELDQVQAKSQITAVIAAGAGNRITALRWITSTETFYHRQCVEGWVYGQGILFTDYGRELVEELMEIVTFEEIE